MEHSNDHPKNSDSPEQDQDIFLEEVTEVTSEQSNPAPKESTTPIKAGGRKAAKYRANTCLNCSHPLELSDVYCSYCAQLNTTKKLTVGDFFNELFASFISFDSRFRQSLKILVFKPGVMSREFVAGKRMKYMNPFRFYLSVSILFFIIFGFISNYDQIQFDSPGEIIKEELASGANNININGVQVKNWAELDSLVKAEGNQNISIDSLLNAKFKTDPENDSISSYKDDYLSESQLDTLGFFKGNFKRFQLYQAYSKETEINIAKRGLDSLSHENTAFHRWIYNKGVDSNRIGKEPGQLMEYFVNQLPFIIFFFIPIFTLVVWLVYIRRRQFSYTDHMIFLFHTQTMFFVLYGVAIIIDAIFDFDYGVSIATLIFLFYLYKAMRNFYKQRRFKTIVKFLILNTVFFILATVGAVVAFAISFATY